MFCTVKSWTFRARHLGEKQMFLLDKWPELHHEYLSEVQKLRFHPWQPYFFILLATFLPKFCDCFKSEQSWCITPLKANNPHSKYPKIISRRYTFYDKAFPLIRNPNIISVLYTILLYTILGASIIPSPLSTCLRYDFLLIK